MLSPQVSKTKLVKPLVLAIRKTHSLSYHPIEIRLL
jgi:hypothetical protein